MKYEITCNTLQIEIVVSQFPFQKADVSCLAANSSITLPTILLCSLSNYLG